jgi:hypothetical protein
MYETSTTPEWSPWLLASHPSCGERIAALATALSYS